MWGLEIVNGVVVTKIPLDELISNDTAVHMQLRILVCFMHDTGTGYYNCAEDCQITSEDWYMDFKCCDKNVNCDPNAVCKTTNPTIDY